jgi:hypothetical protein
MGKGLRTGMGSVANLFARSHPLVYRRKLAKLRNGTSALVPRDAEEGDIIVHFVGSQIPFVLRPLALEERRRQEAGGFLSKVMSKMTTWAFWLRHREVEVENVDAEVLSALRQKGAELGGGKVEVEHYVFVGECIVDGLKQGSSDLSGEKDERRKIVFALH